MDNQDNPQDLETMKDKISKMTRRELADFAKAKGFSNEELQAWGRNRAQLVVGLVERLPDIIRRGAHRADPKPPIAAPGPTHAPGPQEHSLGMRRAPSVIVWRAAGHLPAHLGELNGRIEQWRVDNNFPWKLPELPIKLVIECTQDQTFDDKAIAIEFLAHSGNKPLRGGVTFRNVFR